MNPSAASLDTTQSSSEANSNHPAHNASPFLMWWKTNSKQKDLKILVYFYIHRPKKKKITLSHLILLLWYFHYVAVSQNKHHAQREYSPRDEHCIDIMSNINAFPVSRPRSKTWEDGDTMAQIPSVWQERAATILAPVLPGRYYSPRLPSFCDSFNAVACRAGTGVDNDTG